MKRSIANDEWFRPPEGSPSPCVERDIELVSLPGASEVPPVFFEIAAASPSEDDASLNALDVSSSVACAHRRWLVRSAAIVGAASAVGLLVLLDMLLRAPAMATATDGRSTMPVPAAPSASPAAALASESPPEPAVAEAARLVGGEQEPLPPEEAPGERRLPELLPKAPAGHAKAAAHLRIANDQLKGGYFNWARWNYAEAAKLSPGDPEAHLGLALAATEMRRDRLARSEVEKVLALDPAHPLGHLLAGHLSQLHGDMADAVRHYRKYLEVESEGPFASQARAIIPFLESPEGGGKP